MPDLTLLLTRHTARVRALAARIVGDADDAEDVVQETLVEVWRRAGDFDHRRGGESAWVNVIARSRALDLLRRREARTRLLDGRLDAHEPAATPHPLNNALRTALSRLPASQQIAIELAYVQELTHVEIAAGLAVPLGTIKTRIRAGLRRMAAQLVDGEAANRDGELSDARGAAATRSR